VYEVVNVWKLARLGHEIYRLAFAGTSRGAQVDNDFFESKRRLAWRRLEKVFAHHFHATAEAPERWKHGTDGAAAMGAGVVCQPLKIAPGVVI
jgi:hypothetical protein